MKPIDKELACPLYMPQLDGLRAVAVAAVVWFHYTDFQYICGVPVGTLGVQLFFVLSGFLITGILLRYGSGRATDKLYFLRNFYILRALRLCPLFYSTLALLIILNAPTYREYIFWHVLYLSNVFQFLFKVDTYGTHFWTLAVEEQFYLCWPLIVLFLRPRQVVYICVTLIVAAPVFRYVFRDIEYANRLLPAALDFLAAGALLACFHLRLPVSTANWVVDLLAIFGVFGAAAGLVLPALFLIPTSVCLIFTWIIWRARVGFSGAIGSALMSPPLVGIGRVSYGIYVLHPIAIFLWHWFLFTAPVPGYRIFARIGIPKSVYENPITEISVGLTLTAFMVTISWHFLESPCNELKHRFPYTRLKTG